MAKREKDPRKIIDDLFAWVEQYRVASETIEGIENAFIPRAQIRGLLIELAFKTYLAACGVYKEGHDLSKLAKNCEGHGLTLDKHDWEYVIEPLQERYYVDDALNWEYPSRYPMEDRGTVLWRTPGHANVDGLVGQILDQAAARRAA